MNIDNVSIALRESVSSRSMRFSRKVEREASRSRNVIERSRQWHLLLLYDAVSMAQDVRAGGSYSRDTVPASSDHAMSVSKCDVSKGGGSNVLLVIVEVLSSCAVKGASTIEGRGVASVVLRSPNLEDDSLVMVILSTVAILGEE
jgi:hypothetical protein